MIRIFAIFFCLFYSLMVSGLSLDFHFCANKLMSVHFPNDNHSEDGCCGSKEKSKKCCTNKTASFNLKEKHENVLKTNVPAQPCKSISAVFSYVPDHFSTFYIACPLEINIPPPLTANISKTPVFLFKRVLLI